MNKFVFIILFSILTIFSLSSCSEQSIAGPIDNKGSNNLPITLESESNKIKINNCICAQIWMPVCGEDNKTYSNACSAKCANVKFKMGSCEKSNI